MSKHPERKTAKQHAEIGNERRDRTSTVTFSIRLTSTERELLAGAAKFKGWTTTHLPTMRCGSVHVKRRLPDTHTRRR